MARAICKICGAEKSASEFYADSRYRDGHDSRCKVCLRASWSKGRTGRGRDRKTANKAQQKRRKAGGASYRAKAALAMRSLRYAGIFRALLAAGNLPRPLPPLTVERADSLLHWWEERGLVAFRKYRAEALGVLRKILEEPKESH